MSQTDRPSVPPPAADGSRRPARLVATLWPILLKTGRDFSDDHIPNVAASVTFYALLAIFPALSAVVSLYGLFGDVQAPRRAVMQLSGLLPGGAIQVIGDDLQRLARAPHASLGLTFAAGVLISLYSANAGVKALVAGLAVAYEDTRPRGFLRLYLVSSGFTLGAVVMTLAGAALMTLAGGLAAAPVWRGLILAAALAASLWSLYRFAPADRAKHHHTAPGGLAAGAAWIAMSAGFSGYVVRFGHYNQTFGSLGAVAGFMTWIWLSVMIILSGAELNAAVDAARARGASDTGKGW